MEKLKVRITFMEECLGTSPGDKDVFKTYIGSKAPDAATMEQEVEALGPEAVEQKQMTIFPKEKDKPFLWDYQMKGFFKSACQNCALIPKSESADIKAYKKRIDGLIFVRPRKIFFEVPTGAKIGICQRPLRASTPQGERVALAMSESLPIGTSVELEIIDLSEKYIKPIREWLNYGEWSGLLQWRNSGKGRFEWEEIEDTTKGKTKSKK